MGRSLPWDQRLTATWRDLGLGESSPRGNPVWVKYLADLGPGAEIGIELDGSAVVGPPAESTWDYTAGHDVHAARVGDPIEAAVLDYNWLMSDTTAASTLTAFRGRDLVKAWVTLTAGDRLGGLASIAIARSVFETGLEAFRVATTVRDALAAAPLEKGNLIGISDGVWVPLFRYLGGEKTSVVSKREETRNTLANIRWLRTGDLTQVLADDYDLVSRLLHSSGRELPTESSRLPEQAELSLLASGASATLQAYQYFRHAAFALSDFVEHARSLTEVNAVVAVGHDPNISRLPLSTPRTDLSRLSDN